MADKQGVEIDYCPECRGIWLDRGELEKIIERSASQSDYSERSHDRKVKFDDDDDHFERKDHNYGYQKEGKPYKKKSFLGDLFDF
jgi:Zn-finger nucleic acid-binding protein